MHNNYYFLRQLTIQLSDILIGLKLIDCFSQEKDEIMLQFEGDQPFFIRGYLKSDFSCLSFPTSFTRSNKNNVDLFKELFGLKVTDIVQSKNDRSFTIFFETGYNLIFKLHGNRSNLILLKDNQVLRLFHKKMAKDFSVSPESLNKMIKQDYEHFIENGGNLKKNFPTYDQSIIDHINNHGYETATMDQKWKIIITLEGYLQSPTYYVYSGFPPKLSLFDVQEPIVLKTANPIEAINEFFLNYTSKHFFEVEKRHIMLKVQEKLTKDRNYLSKINEKWQQHSEKTKYREIADIIMANLHQIDKDSETVQLLNFYTNKIEQIKLKPQISAQKNAENYYRKGKNEKLEEDHLLDTIEKREQSLIKNQKYLDELLTISDFKSLRKFTRQILPDLANEHEKETFKKFNYNGFEILVGKNAENNDLLLKAAFKDDLWLHARDVSGSHVIIKYKSGLNFPQNVIEKAAQVAAYYSKRKTDSLCPVIFTPKKYIRKRKGAPAGQVIVEKEKVIMVVPGMIDN